MIKTNAMDIRTHAVSPELITETGASALPENGMRKNETMKLKTRKNLSDFNLHYL